MNQQCSRGAAATLLGAAIIAGGLACSGGDGPAAGKATSGADEEGVTALESTRQAKQAVAAVRVEAGRLLPDVDLGPGQAHWWMYKDKPGYWQVRLGEAGKETTAEALQEPSGLWDVNLLTVYGGRVYLGGDGKWKFWDAEPLVAEDARPKGKAQSKAASKPLRYVRRTWTSDDGEFQIEGEFVSLQLGLVRIRIADGELMEAPLDRLSPADQQWIDENVR